MSAVCQLVLMDAAFSTGRFDEEGNELYDRRDVENALAFVEQLRTGEQLPDYAGIEKYILLKWLKEKLEAWKDADQ